MTNKINKLKIHKCSIKECTNLVKFKGSFCRHCIEKICDDSYTAIFCPLCESIIDIIKSEECNGYESDKIKLCFCNDCISKFDIIEGDDEPLDE